ncbi:MAG: CRISPR-associated DxTHG motif protein [Candidatus Lokiarchaeota archaeon]|nr:CRISPR-associated DxTHG motif protein [Candidatus Lokiarchaeota archaeon]
MNSDNDEAIKVLLTFLGDRREDRPYELVEYCLEKEGTKTIQTHITGAALAHLTGPYDKVVVFVTKTSSKNISILSEDLGEMEKLLHIHEIEEEYDEGSLLLAIDTIISAVSAEGRPVNLVIDITHGFRYLALLYFSAISYLTLFREVKIDGIFYGKYTGTNQTAIIDLTPAYAFVQWTQAAHAFTESGKVDFLARMLHARKMDLITSNQSDKSMNDVVKCLQGMAYPLTHPLPIEIGQAVHLFLNALDELKNESLLSPAFAHVLDDITQRIAPLSGQMIPRKKREVILDNDEIRKELKIAAWFLAHGRLGDALIVLREYLVNAVLLCENKDDWLVHEERVRVSSRLSALSRNIENESISQLLSENQREIADIWQELSVLRNSYAHAGFKQDRIRPDREMTRAYELLERCSNLPAVTLRFESTHGRLLISPLGLSPGTLYSALLRFEPDFVIVLTSSDSIEAIDQIVKKANFPKEAVKTISYVDPFVGYEEIPHIVNSCLEDLLLSDQVICNITGGTTLMGETVRTIYEHCRRFDISSQLFALIDRRSRKEQEKNPFFLGDCIQLS